MSNPGHFLRLRTEDIGPRDGNLLSDTDEQICISSQNRIDELEMFYYHALSVVDSLDNGVDQNRELRKAHLKPYVEMIGVR